MTKKLIKQITWTNQQILFEFYNLMKGVIYNRYNKSKGFQFALLDKNLTGLSKLMAKNNDLIRTFAGKMISVSNLYKNTEMFIYKYHIKWYWGNKNDI